ncbi:hypothetical protein N9W79_02210, partial [bacterium]|nr:hypothetical protein [bacterium]
AQTALYLPIKSSFVSIVLSFMMGRLYFAKESISNVKKHEEEIQQNKILSTIRYDLLRKISESISYQLNNPMAIAEYNLERASKGDDQKNNIVYLDSVKKQLGRISQIGKSLPEVAKKKIGKETVFAESDEVKDQIVELLTEKSEKYGIEYDVILDCDSETVSIDKTVYVDAVSEMIENAMVESVSTNKTPVSVSVYSNDYSFGVLVSNEIKKNSVPKPEILADPFYTTRGSHHWGLGMTKIEVASDFHTGDWGLEISETRFMCYLEIPLIPKELLDSIKSLGGEIKRSA